VFFSPGALENELTQRYIRQYTSPGGISWLNGVLARGSVYIPFIQEEIARRNLPPELAWLPVIESGFQSTAKSKSGAVGLWQFMMNSIGPFNMKVNDLLDERRDFQKSTRGALQKLEENYRFFGSWPMALAAYNTGLGGVNRIIQKTGIRDYWALCEKKEFRTETIHYVPKFLAVAYIISQPRRFGIEFWPEAIEWSPIPVGKQVALDILAAETGIDPELLRKGNQELIYGITPQDQSYRLKVPASALPLVTELLEREDLKLLEYYRYVVKYGDTLSALSRHYGVSLELIGRHNPGILNRYLKIGETIIVPAFKETGPYAGARAGGAGGSGPDALSFGGTHLVKRGETLWSLALAYDVDPEVLAEANGMELNQILPEGKSLKVPIIN
jgi:membrane-bound lytic murein transglycosylase D